MLRATLLLLLAALCSAQHPLQPGEPLSPEEQRAAAFVTKAEEELLENARQATLVEWAYYTNITDHNEKVRLDYQKVSDALSLKLGKEAKQFDVNRIRDRDVRRKLEMISQTGTAILPDDKRERFVSSCLPLLLLLLLLLWWWWWLLPFGFRCCCCCCCAFHCHCC